jgi:CRP-like cAMP-binding protein
MPCIYHLGVSESSALFRRVEVPLALKRRAPYPRSGVNSQHLRSFVNHSAPQRIARLMLDGSHEDARTVTGRGIKVALTHEEIGMSRETVTRTLADFRRQRFAALRGSTLLIQNVAALQKLAS